MTTWEVVQPSQVNIQDENRHDGILYGAPGVAVLRGHRLLRHLPDGEFVQFLKAGKLRASGRGDVVVQQGKAVENVFFIVSGRAKAEVSALTKGATKAVVNLLGPGDDMGLLSIVDSGPHSASVTALEDLNAISVPLAVMQGYLLSHPEWYRALTETALARLRTSGVWLQALM